MAHNVLLIAFDIDSNDSTMEGTEKRLHDLLPAGDTEHPNGLHIDAWWVADDERYDGSDCDSAVFVTPGRQAEARALLKAAGLAR